jgi:hypothetical protein
MKVTIHQPEYIVWLGLLGKIASADLFVILDTVQFKKENFQNRNRIRTLNGWTWLTVPIKKMSHRTLIRDIQISYDQDWIGNHIKIMRANYKQSRYFNFYIEEIGLILKERDRSLSKLNINLINFLLKIYQIKTEVLISSEMDIGIISGATEVNLEICRSVGATGYIAGPGSKKYLDENKFKDCGIDISFYNFIHPNYKQLHDPFIPNMSSVDLLFNHGEEGVEIFKKSIR